VDEWGRRTARFVGYAVIVLATTWITLTIVGAIANGVASQIAN
jgi:hypothetical protein